MKPLEIAQALLIAIAVYGGALADLMQHNSQRTANVILHVNGDARQTTSIHYKTNVR